MTQYNRGGDPDAAWRKSPTQACCPWCGEPLKSEDYALNHMVGYHNAELHNLPSEYKRGSYLYIAYRINKGRDKHGRLREWPVIIAQ